MATGDQFDYVDYKRLFPENGANLQVARGLATSGKLAGVPLHGLDTDGYNFTTRIWSNGTPLPTGLTFGVELTDDPNNPGASGVVVLGITVKRLVSGTDDTTSTGAGAEQTFNVTMPATSGVFLRQNCAIANANLDALAAGDTAMIRVRRIKSNAADTHPGVPLIGGISVRDT